MDIKLYKRIRELRKKYGYESMQKFADELDVNIQNVKKWESEKDQVIPRLDYLLAMCDLFGCDLDHLVGRLPETTYDIHFIHDYTGLSEEAINKISHPATINGEKVPGPVAASLSHLIESDGFEDFMNAYMTFMAASDRLEKSVIHKEAHSVIKPDEVILPIDEATRFYIQQVSAAIIRLCEPDYRKSYAECMKNSKRTGGKK